MAGSPVSGPPRLDGQVALVTGAAGGIGRAVVRVLAEAGARVVATDIVAEADLAQAAGYKRCDLTSQQDSERLIDEVCAEFGAVDILVLCAGSISNKPLWESTDEEWKSVFDVNVMGVVHPVRKLYPLMAERGYGKIVALGSIAAKIGGVASGPSYVAAKSAVHGLMKWVAKAGAGKGVYANIIAPGPVETPMWANVTGQAPPSASGSVPLGRFGTPDDIAQSILFLCSPASNWITGTVLDVNGGMLMD
ncbi:SDR family NAD(P)-dependent oxidoreductase [Azorhizobium doebereinerae]|uniref:SDR family NAD(P)-dependent oxidoreductase n=1 Tax=Azorhizobium doebereinerae TaxID=281091 RepID=UPI000490F1D1|nr:SDR family oxidoreductase [Azorhizobium doebereinerae]